METYASINSRKRSVLTELNKMEWYPKLKTYKIVDELQEYRLGRHIRWINSNLKLTNGGILVDIFIMEDGVRLRTKNNMNRFITIAPDDCVVFQKISYDEAVMLAAAQKLSS